MVHLATFTLLSLLSTAFATYGHPGTISGTISGTGSLPPYPTYSAPYPISNSTVPTGPTDTYSPPPPLPTTTTECPPPVTVTVTNSVTVTTTVTTSSITTTTLPPGTGTGGTAAPTGTASAGYGYGHGYSRRGLEMRGLAYREERKEKRSSWFSWL